MDFETPRGLSEICIHQPIEAGADNIPVECYYWKYAYTSPLPAKDRNFKRSDEALFLSICLSYMISRLSI